MACPHYQERQQCQTSRCETTWTFHMIQFPVSNSTQVCMGLLCLIFGPWAAFLCGPTHQQDREWNSCATSPNITEHQHKNSLNQFERHTEFLQRTSRHHIQELEATASPVLQWTMRGEGVIQRTAETQPCWSALDASRTPLSAKNRTGAPFSTIALMRFVWPY